MLNIEACMYIMDLNNFPPDLIYIQFVFMFITKLIDVKMLTILDLFDKYGSHFEIQDGCQINHISAGPPPSKDTTNISFYYSAKFYASFTRLNLCPK